jgi:3-oxoacyl-[acyl-carrier-protein] synthase II
MPSLMLLIPSGLGKADIIITGGSEAVMSAAGVGGFNAMKALE